MPRPLVTRNVVARLQSYVEPRTIFDGFTERFVLEKLLREPASPKSFPFPEAREYLLKQRSEQRSKKAQQMQIQSTLKSSIKPSSPTGESAELMKRQAVTSRDLDAFLNQNYLQNVPRSEMRERIHEGIIDLIGASSANNLRALILYLSKYWQGGINGVRPTIEEARGQARLLLTRAVEVHPRTTHEGGGEQVGLPDFHRFEQFVENFFKYLEVNRRANDELDDLLLQLCSKSGFLQTTTSLITRRSQVNEEALQMFLSALESSHPTAETLLPFKELLLNDHSGPAAINFMLQHVNSMDDIMFILEVADRSVFKREIYEQCQTMVIETVLKLKPDTLAYMFGVLHRIRAIAPVSAATLDVALESGLRLENPAALNRLLSRCKHKSEAVERANKYVHTLP